MSVLDLSVPDFQILIDTFDISGAVDSFNVIHPLAERNTPLTWSGSIELSYLINQADFAESFDDWINPTRFAGGNHPVYLYLDGSLFQTLRIDRLGYTYQEDPSGGTLATIQLTDILGLLAGNFTPPQDAPGIAIGDGTRWELAAKALVEAAIAQVNTVRVARGLSPISFTVDISLTDIDELFTAPRTVEGSFIQEAQKICGERGYYLWSDNEVIKLARYPEAGAPIYQKSRRKVDRYDRAQGLEEPLTKLTVTGSCQRADGCGATYPKVRVEYGAKLDNSPYVRRRVTEDRQQVGNVITETVTEEAALFQAYPGGDDFDFSGDPYATVTVSVARKITTLSSPDQRILQVETDVDKAIGCFTDFRASFLVPSWSVLMPSCEKVITRYNTDANGQLESIETDEYSPAFQLFTINGSAPLVQQVAATIRYRTIESWEKECGDVYRKLTTRYVAAVSSGSSANSLSFESETVEPNSSPPEQPVWEPSYPLTTELLAGSAEFDYAQASAYLPNDGEEQAETLVSNAGCERLARHLGSLRWQRYYARDISHGYEASVLSYEPFQIVHVHTGAVIRDGFSITMGDSQEGDRKEFVVSYRGNLLGVITPVPESPGAAAIPVSLIKAILTPEVSIGVSVEVSIGYNRIAAAESTTAIATESVITSNPFAEITIGISTESEVTGQDLISEFLTEIVVDSYLEITGYGAESITVITTEVEITLQGLLAESVTAIVTESELRSGLIWDELTEEQWDNMTEEQWDNME